MKNPLKNKGSVLVFSLIVLSIVLSAALSVAVVNVSNRKSAGSTAQSVQSFQVADSAVEMMLKKIYKDNTNVALSTLGSSCSSGVVGTSVSGGTANISFYNSSNVQITDCTSTIWRDDLAKIKVEGTASGTTRVIETAIAAGCSWNSIGASVTGDASLSPRPMGVCRFTLPAGSVGGLTWARSFVWYGSVFHNATGNWSCSVPAVCGGSEVAWKNSGGTYFLCGSASTDSTETSIEYLSCN